MKLIYLSPIILLLLLAGCGKFPDTDEPGVCESYGVQERDIKLGEVYNVFELPDSEIHAICGPSGWIDRNPSGCYKVQKDGLVDIYFREGDKCTKIHEECHVKHGPYHTKQYISDVAKNHPRPSCPS